MLTLSKTSKFPILFPLMFLYKIRSIQLLPVDESKVGKLLESFRIIIAFPHSTINLGHSPDSVSPDLAIILE